MVSNFVIHTAICYNIDTVDVNQGGNLIAMILIGTDTFIDTDDLEQAEYHYFRKAESLGRRDIARAILKGRIDAFEIDHDSEYEWLRTPDKGVHLKTI